MSDFATRLRAAITFKKRDYQLTFGSVSGRRVLADLATFCKADETCVVTKNGVVDREQSFILEGRRQAFLRIQRMLRLSSDELFDMVHGPRETIDG